MACSIDATPGGVGANSYATIAEATAYNEGHVSGAAWAAAVDDTKCRALQTATRLLDSYVQWLGSPASDSQALAWPRIGMEMVQGCIEGDDGFVSSTTIPPQLKRAAAEFARLLLGGDTTAPNPTEQAGLSMLTAGDIQLVFRSPTESASSPSRAVVPGSVLAYLRPWMSAHGVARTLIRV